uniref:Uncharacterized protein n=1 Tax=Triticum urartu TaxID=4572 RepID=A0A8R7TGJ5_TRIUA
MQIRGIKKVRKDHTTDRHNIRGVMYWKKEIKLVHVLQFLSDWRQNSSESRE